jgi:transcriptional repressor NrdR
MKCPYCGEIDNKVIDSRLSKDASVIRRRRECIVCSRRFTTYEHIEEIPIMIVKKDGRREVFNREKVRSGLKKACQKRNISVNVIEEFIDDLERDLRETGEKEIPASFMTWPMFVLPRFTGNLRMSTTLSPSSKPCSANRSDF